MDGTYSANKLINEQFSIGLKPDPKYTVSEWSDKHRILPSSSAAEPGKYRTSRTPFLRKIMDELSPQSLNQTITVMKGSQIGATEAGNNWVGTVIDHVPGPMLYVLPTLDLAKRTSKQRLQPMIDNCPTLRGKVKDRRSRDSGNSMFAKEFQGGILIMAGSNSAAGLRSMPCRYLFLDELSAYEQDVDGEGDPVELAKKRSATFKRHRKIFQPSTPTIKGSCRVETEFLKSDQQYYNIPCPLCGHKQTIEFENIKWDKDDEGKHKPETAFLQCKSCKGRIEERYKTWFLDEANGAEWIATAKGEPYHVGFHLNSLYSPLGWYSWEDAVRDFLQAKKRSEMGDLSQLKTFTNTVLGKTWVARGTQVNHHHLWKNRENYPVDIDVPMGAVVLTSGVDIQDDRIEASVYGWGDYQECWAIEHRVFWGNTSDRSDECYTRLDELLLNTQYKHESGKKIGISCACVDTGFNTSQVYDYILTRQRQGIYAIKGDNGAEGAVIVSAAKEKRSGRDRRPVRLFFAGTFEAKRLIYGRLMMEKKDGAGVIHFPIAEDYDEEFFEQLTAERIEENFHKGFVKRSFVKTRARNEALDTLVYALCALEIYRPNYANLAEQYGTDNVETNEEPKDTNTEHTRKRSSSRRNIYRKKSGWVSNW